MRSYSTRTADLFFVPGSCVHIHAPHAETNVTLQWGFLLAYSGCMAITPSTTHSAAMLFAKTYSRYATALSDIGHRIDTVDRINRRDRRDRKDRIDRIDRIDRTDRIGR